VDDAVRQTPIELRRERGVSLLKDPDRLESHLCDLAPGKHAEIHCLVAAVREGVVTDLLSASGAVPIDALIPRLSARLQQRTAMNPEAARWAVRSLALALGLRYLGAATSAPRRGARSTAGQPAGAAGHSARPGEGAAGPQTKQGAQRQAKPTGPGSPPIFPPLADFSAIVKELLAMLYPGRAADASRQPTQAGPASTTAQESVWSRLRRFWHTAPWQLAAAIILTAIAVVVLLVTR